VKLLGIILAILVAMLSTSRAFAEDAPSDLNTTESWVKIIGGIIAAAVALLAAFKALAEWRRSIKQREEELKKRAEELELRKSEFRHKQAIFALNLISEVFKDPKSRAALTMLDWDNFDYTDEAGTKYTVNECEIKKALNPDLEADDKEVFIRTRFEALYDHLEQIQHLISLKIVNFDDVKIAFRYYMQNALDPVIEHIDFLEKFDYPGAKTFVLRFEAKKKRRKPSKSGAKTPNR
jgi:hypothetical protein